MSKALPTLLLFKGLGPKTLIPFFLKVATKGIICMCIFKLEFLQIYFYTQFYWKFGAKIINNYSNNRQYFGTENLRHQTAI